jgi:cytochrome c oxidase subunit 1
MLLDLLKTTDHKLIGKMYLVTAFAFFLAGGVMALLMRGELARPGGPAHTRPHDAHRAA